MSVMKLLLLAGSDRRARGARPRPAFTLLEMLVAVGAVALIGLGLARVFSATSGTLRAGKRISLLNDTAAMLERTLRSDIDAMTREGFLVIVNENAYDPGDFNNRRGSRLNSQADQGSELPRRIDQLMFFSEGQFRSMRAQLHESRQATANQARIWWGHGLRQWDDSSPPANPPVLRLDDQDDSTNATPQNERLPYFGQPGPNQYAADWTLLRAEHLLTTPSPSVPPYPASLTWPTLQQWSDNPIQIGLQPTQSNLFWHTSQAEPVALPGAARLCRDGDPQVAHPLTASGLVDVINGNLSDVRAMILDAQANAMSPLPGAHPLLQPYDFSGDGSNPNIVVTAFDPDGNRTNASTNAMKQWMRYALPAAPRLTPGYQADAHGGRMRYQSLPVDYLGTYRNSGAGVTYAPTQDFRRTDQMMLTQSKLIAGCTSFIVEWSFGEVYKANDPFVMSTPERRRLEGQLIWHGLTRHSDMNFDGAIDQRVDNEAIVRPYLGFLDQTLFTASSVRPTSYPPAANPRPQGQTPSDAHFVEYDLPSGQKSPVPWRLKGEVINDATPDGSLYQTFGYYDATFAPGSAAASTSGFSDNDFYVEFQPATMPVPWPKLIRVTVTLVDPSDTEDQREQTFQFVFEVPAPRAGSVN
ncbi:MAG: hypothetical protein IT438_01575 [Phycisphaerales bacterium]|nr:hypothetical protein [Phycisphaerales bacterium]